MAEPQSAGEFLLEKFGDGVVELQQANAGQMAMDAAPIEAPQAPAVEAPSGYEAALNQAAQVAEVRAPEVDMGMER